MTIKKLEPQPSAPRPSTQAPVPSTPRPPVPLGGDPNESLINAKTGRTSSFEAYKPPPVQMQRGNPNATVEGRGKGTNDDSVGRGYGTNDDSVGRGRGTNDDSVGRGRGTNDDSVGRGTNDDSVGRGKGTNDDSIGRGKGTNDDSIGRGKGTNDDSIGLVQTPAGRAPGDAGVGAAANLGAGGMANISLPFGGSVRVPLPPTPKQNQLLGSRDADVVKQASFVFSTPEFQAMPPTQRAQITDVMLAGGRPAARAMAEMFEQSGGAMLNATGNDGKTVLDNLSRLAASKEGPRVLGDVMYDLVNPGRIWQGRAPTCTVSTMQYELASLDPGEYSRLMTGLVADREVTMRGGGTMTINPDWAMQASGERQDKRSTSEAIFQAAAMDFANGDDAYLVYAQESAGKNGVYRGLHGDQISEMLHQLAGVQYETKQIGTDEEADAELNQILERERPNRPVLFVITIPGSRSNHCVSLVDVKADSVIFRDPTTGSLASMSKDEFRQSLAAVHFAPPTLAENAARFASRFKNFHF